MALDRKELNLNQLLKLESSEEKLYGETGLSLKLIASRPLLIDCNCAFGRIEMGKSISTLSLLRICGPPPCPGSVSLSATTIHANPYRGMARRRRNEFGKTLE